MTEMRDSPFVNLLILKVKNGAVMIIFKNPLVLGRVAISANCMENVDK